MNKQDYKKNVSEVIINDSNIFLIIKSGDEIIFTSDKTNSAKNWSLNDIVKHFQILQIDKFYDFLNSKENSSKFLTNSNKILLVHKESVHLEKKEYQIISCIILPNHSLVKETSLLANLSKTNLFGLFITDEEKIIFINDKGCDILNLSTKEVIGKKILDFIHEDDRKKLATKTEQHKTVKFISPKKGEVKYCELFITTSNIDGKNITIGFFIDRTKRIELEKELKYKENLFRNIADSSFVGIFLVKNNKFIYVNNYLAEKSGYTKEELLSFEDFTTIIHPDDKLLVLKMMQEKIENPKKQTHYTIRALNKAKETLYCEIHSSIISINDENIIQGTIIDITEQKMAIEKLEKMVMYDQLTGLYSRTILMDRLKYLTNLAIRTNFLAAVLFIDLDGFKNVNDIYGHGIGDKLLEIAGNRLKKLFRASDTVARFGGDEFVILLSNLKSEMEAVKLAERVIKEIEKPFEIENNQIYISASIGISLIPKHTNNPELAIKFADMAMYYAKRNRFQKIVMFSEDLHHLETKTTNVENFIRTVCIKGEGEDYFEMHYHPIFLVGSKTECIALEALLRVKPEKKLLFHATDMVSAAERLGFDIKLDMLICELVFKDIKRLRIKQRICINISSNTIKSFQFINHILRLIAEYEINPSNIVFELTERVLIDDPTLPKKNMQTLASHGFMFYIDDFGTGYSSVERLLTLPVNGIKLDKVFVDKLIHDKLSIKLVAGMKSICKEFDIDMIVEGVETKEQLNILQKLECNKIQGFYFKKPLNTTDLAAITRYYN